ncbi:hypothetical protein L2K70_07790 [Nocardioides KLBMP 9356]|uniref:Uncharacterized protein n=1 Tax=Nocardioides potassii TaxID=2911371 RepID=A0ABS9HAN0_9ACTN|nr:hypothetical protein [Nocardioides potassii]MCF6377504.1 hypothetical protein [Nocardioides potassii]
MPTRADPPLPSVAVRSQTWSEVMGRIASHLMFTSASLLFLALAGPAMSFSGTFRLLAILLGLTLLVAGTLTSFRVHNASQEDYMFIKGMNRLRAGYIDIDPHAGAVLHHRPPRRRAWDRPDVRDGGTAP